MGLNQTASRMWTFCCLLLFLYDVTKSQSISSPPSPCPSTFQYGQDSNGEMIGHIEILSMDTSIVILIVELSVGNDVLSNYFGEIKLAGKNQPTINDIQQRKPIRYILRFPRWESSPPRVTKIQVNGRIVCEGNPIRNARVVINVTLKHKLKILSSVLGDNPFDRNSPLLESLERPIFGGNKENNRPPIQTIDDSVIKDLTISITSASTQREPSPSSFTKNPSLLPTRRKTWPTKTSTQPTTQNAPWLPTKIGIKPTVSGECGRASTRLVELVVSGDTVEHGEYPWLVAMFLASSSSQLSSYRCCGNLVSTKHVVTAAHCVYDSRGLILAEKLSIVLGKLNIRNLPTPKYPNVVRVSLSLPHPEYVPLSRDTNRKPTADLAIVVLDTVVEFNQFIRPICLWSEDNDLDLVVNQNGTIVGWGRDENGADSTEEPKQISVPIVGQSTCLRSYDAFNAFTSNTTFCAGAKDKKGPCTGDSGSGFIMNRNGKWTLRGIVSSSIFDSIRKTCDLTHYVIFTDVSKYLPWIHKQISST